MLLTIHTMSHTVCVYKLCKESTEQEKNQQQYTHTHTRSKRENPGNVKENNFKSEKNATPKERNIESLKIHIKDQTKVKTPMG